MAVFIVDKMSERLYPLLTKLIVDNGMGRTRLSSKRLSETKKANIGHIIIFYEGQTEKYNTYGKYLAFDCDDPPDI